MAVIYMITNNLNGKSYIGFTKHSVNHRIRQHRSTHCRWKSVIQDAIKKYGWDSFTTTILEESDDVEFLHKIREPYWISKKNTMVPNGYNVQQGGEGNTNPTRRRPIMMYDCNLEYIRTFESAAHCAEYLGSDRSVVYSAAVNSTKNKGSKTKSKIDNQIYYVCFVGFFPVKKSTAYLPAQCEKMSLRNKGVKRPQHSQFMKDLRKQRADKTVYNFINTDGREFVGTRRELMEIDDKVVNGELGNMIKGKYKTHKGWMLKNEEIK